MKINKTISYVTFVLKELYEYYQMKTENGIFIISIRDQKSRYEQNVQKLEKLRLLI